MGCKRAKNFTVITYLLLTDIRFNLCEVDLTHANLNLTHTKVRFRSHDVRFNPTKVKFPYKMANSMFKLKIYVHDVHIENGKSI